MTNSINEIKEFITYWTAQDSSEQRDTVLTYWVGQAQRFIKYSRKVVSNEGSRLVNNTGSEVKMAVRLVANHFNVPMMKKGENRNNVMTRLCNMS